MSRRRVIFACAFGWAATVAIWAPLGWAFDVATLPLSLASAATSFVLCEVGLRIAQRWDETLWDYIAAGWIWLVTLRCDHPHVRCVHGDEINRAGGRRSLCTRCYRYLTGGLPAVCTSTGRSHR